ncbi:MAG: hypothetical protein K5769_03290 [Pseudobutyrivibrio sp.]|nr:hypothetical protein [Pseudobutyrivibrio sp.]
MNNENFLQAKYFDLDNVKADTEYYLFCFGHAGTWSVMFQNWQKELSDRVAVIPVVMPGKGERIDERPFSKMEPLVKSLSYVLKTFAGKKLLFYGNCLGGLEAFEIARELESSYSIKVEHLFISAQESPGCIHTENPIHKLEDELFIEKVKEKNGTPKEVFENTQLTKLLLGGLRADFKIYETYKFKEKKIPSFPITAFFGSEDSDITEEKIIGWKDETVGSFQYYEMEGGHFFATEKYGEMLEIIESSLGNGK